MLFDKKSIDAVAIFAGRNDARYILNGMLIEADGTLVATDGHVLGILSGQKEFETKDFPLSKSETSRPDQPETLKPCVVSLDSMLQVSKAIPKAGNLPILSHALLDTNESNKDGSAVFRVTDLESSQTLTARKIDGNFPNYKQWGPSMEPCYRVYVSAELLMRLCKAAATMYGKKNVHPPAIEFEFFENGRGPIRATIKNHEQQTLTAIVMPIKGEREVGLLAGDEAATGTNPQGKAKPVAKGKAKG